MGWGPVGSGCYLRPDQFLDHLTVITKVSGNWKLEIGPAKITSYQANLPGSVEVVRVMYGALATQVFECHI